MNQYVTGAMIKRIREQRKMTQSELAQKMCVSDKTISKWETGKGYPDITLIEPLAAALGISVIELMSGDNVTNKNRASNMLKSRIYVCPICGNVIGSTGDAVVSCCGITLPPLEAEAPDSEHEVECSIVEDEFFVTVNHDMTRTHYISFIAAVTDNGVQIIKLYPEGNAEARVKYIGTRKLLYYCNKHGLFELSRAALPRLSK